MEQSFDRSTSRTAPISATRTLMALFAFAAAVTAFGLMTGNPEPGPARAAQPVPAPISSIAQDISPAAEADGNVYIYY